MILESVENGPLIWPTIKENGVTRPRKYSELTHVEAIQVDCDVKETNIILQDLPLDVYALDKVLLVQAQANGQILHEKELAFLADLEITKGQATQTVITYNAAYQADDLDAYDSDCDKLNTTKVAFMAYLSHYGLNVFAEEKCLIITALKDELRKLKRKALVDNVVTTHTIALEMLKINVEPLAPRLLNNRTAHSDYLRLTQEQAVILKEIVKQGKSQNPLNNSLASALVVTPKNKDKRVRFTKPVTSSGTTNTKTTSLSNLVSNKSMLSSTGLKPSTSANGSQPSGNTKKDRIQQPLSCTQKNKVEAHPRIVKSSLKNNNCLVEPKRTAIMQHFKLNVNSKLICVKCNGCMLSDNHDLCVLNAINDVIARPKSKSVKKTVITVI
nr:hypothetical protein [Tanacetum cinerariifolium]